MKNPRFWWILIVCMVVWSLVEIYPPSNQSLILEFQDQADHSATNANFGRILAKAQELEKTNPEPNLEFTNLVSAIGTNNIAPFFPYINVKGQENSNYAILNILQRRA